MPANASDTAAELIDGFAPSEPAMRVPEPMHWAEGIVANGRTVRSFVFSTDVAVICNSDADAVLAVYPFAVQPAIIDALLTATDRPIFTGVGGSVTPPELALRYAKYASERGIAGVVVNMTFATEAIRSIVREIDIPLVLTIGELDEESHEKIQAGASVVNVAAGPQTAQVVAEVRAAYPGLPIMASGGPADKTVRATMVAGAQALSWTPPNIQDIEHALMERTRAVACHECPDAEN